MSTIVKPGVSPPTELHESAPEFPRPAHEAGVLPALWLLWENRRTLWRFTVVGALAFVLLAFLLPKKYKSTAQLMPPDSQSGSGLALMSSLLTGGGAGALGGLAGDLLGMKSTGDLFVGILQSRTVQDDVINHFDLRSVYHTKYYENARKTLSNNTEISTDRKSGIISVTVIDKDPQRAAAIAAEYVADLNRVVAQTSTSSARREREFLEGRLKVVKAELDQAAKDLSAFSSKNSTLDLKEQGKAMVDAAAALQGQLIAAKSELKGLEQIYTPDNIRVRSVQARISELQQQLEKVGGKDISTGDDLASMFPPIRKLPLLAVPYSDLYRRTKIDEAIYETLSAQYELARVQEAKEVPTVKVLDAPMVPERKYSPPRTAIVVLGTMVWFSFGVICVLLRRRWQALRNDDQRKIFANMMYQTGVRWAKSARKQSPSSADEFFRNGP